MKVNIIGGGLAGLSAAFHLNSGFEIELFEKESSVGGLLRTDQLQGFLFDHGPHLFFHQDPYFIEFFEKFVGKDQIEIRGAKTGQYSFKNLIDFPYAMHLYSLPADIKIKCVNDFVRCQIMRNAGGQSPLPIKNYEDYCRVYFGDGFTDHFMIPYAQKIWTVHPRHLDVDWVGQRIVLPEVDQVITGALSSRVLSGNYIKNFRYPKKNGTQAFIDGLVGSMGSNVSLRAGVEIVSIDHKRKKIIDANSKVYEYEYLISSLPLPLLAGIVKDLPSSVVAAIEKLKWFGVLLLNYGGTQILSNEYQWIYFDQNDTKCHRIHYPSKLSNFMTPNPSSQSIQAEISFSKFRKLAGDAESLAEDVWKELQKIGLTEGLTPPFKGFRLIEFAYAIMDHERKQAVDFIRAYLKDIGILTCGRFGEWDYIWTDKVLHSGKAVAEDINEIFQRPRLSLDGGLV